MKNLKKIVIVGRANVGKSTLFNRLSTSVKAITLDIAGVTRDFIKDVITWKNSTFELIDSGGLVLRKSRDEIQQKVREIGLALIDEADLILFVCDGTVGVLQEDKEIAKILHKSNKKIVLVINKIDKKISSEKQYEFESLGFKDVITVSAEHGTNIVDILDKITEFIGESNISEQEQPLFKVTLLGKPNVGKSSLLNTLLNEERSIVSDQPGTTREAISEKIQFYKESIQLTDTAGLRRKRAVTEDIESLMVKSSLAAVRVSDIILLLTDVSEGKISDQELKLAFYCFEHGKSLIVLFNKSDLLTEKQKKDFEDSLTAYNFLFKKIETLYISCKTGKNVGKILTLINKVWQKYSHKFIDIELTEIFKNALQKKPLYHKSSHLLLYSAKQIKTAPITIALNVNEPKWFGTSQLSFFENILRSHYELKSVPILFVLRKQKHSL